LQAGKNLLQWQLTCTNDAGQVDLQRSTDGRQFTTVHTVNLTPTNCGNNMRFEDEQAIAPKYFYRLRITPTGGSVIYSSVILLQNEKEKFSALAVPNVVSDQVSVRIQSLQAGNAQMLIHDVMGKLMQTILLKLINGSQTYSLPVAQYPAGVYFVSISTDVGDKVNVKFVKQ
jgi:Secretion system C-terminal sorting domain